ncbi:MAG: hypothetical protein PVH19_11540, partial [Planctomycetia bacterium]
MIFGSAILPNQPKRAYQSKDKSCSKKGWRYQSMIARPALLTLLGWGEMNRFCSCSVFAHESQIYQSCASQTEIYESAKLYASFGMKSKHSN